jgi:[protein-PII] uridylyltransferase
MSPSTEIKFLQAREKLFRDNKRQKDSLKFSMKYSLLVEEYIRRIAGNKKFNFALVSAGSFSRRELSPYSDIDIMIIGDNPDESAEEVSHLLTAFWDNGIEVSHVLRDFSDIGKYLEADLHSFTQFFETRFILGSAEVYDRWNNFLFALISENDQKRLLNELIADQALRLEKYGDSPKVLEPNVKFSAGGLRDFQLIEWMYIIKHKNLLNKQIEITQSEIFLNLLVDQNYTTPAECQRVLDSYKLVMAVRNLLHLLSGQKNDRFEFTMQPQIAGIFSRRKEGFSLFMREYFKAANIIHRFSKSVVKNFQDDISNPLPDSLAITLDEDFIIKGKTIALSNTHQLTISDILRGFYYRGKYSAHFNEYLRSKIVEIVESSFTMNQYEVESSVFFREILRLEKNVGQTLSVMNELGVLGAYMPEFGEMVGFFQTGVYHNYTSDEHTLMTIKNVEKLEKDTSVLGKIYNGLKNKEILYLALMFHDIGKPIDISGHEIIGAEMASSIMSRLGYSDEEIDIVSFLVKNHLLMEQVAFRRNLNDPETLNTFSLKFSSVEELDLLYLLTFADLSAVNSAVWTSWKSDLLSELYRKAKSMIEEQISGEELLVANTFNVTRDISKFSSDVSEHHVQEHLDSINDVAYSHIFSDEDIARHVEEIRRGVNLSVIFKENIDFTNMTVITKDTQGLLSKICGVLSINDANIHDARIFTRKDGIVIDTFSVTDFRTHKKLSVDNYSEIEKDLSDVLSGIIQLSQEFAGLKSKWWRIENKLFKRTGKIKIEFEKHKKYTIIDVFSPDRLGFLYQVTNKMNELGLVIYFAKIATKGDDIVDSFYVLYRNGRKVSANDFDLIRTELIETITNIL